MTVKEFQAVTGLIVDGISGPKTKAKARELLKVCQKILGNDFGSAEETVLVTQKNPEIWLQKLKTERYFPHFVMNIVERMKGERL